MGEAFAQIPYFASTAGDGKIYGYTSVKYRPTSKDIESYTTFQYGITDYFASGLDLYTVNNQVYLGLTVRGGYKVNKWFGAGLQATPSFDLANNFYFSYFTLGIYLNGALIPSGNLLWCSNTWAVIQRDGCNDWLQKWYIGYKFNFGRHGSMTPMVGCVHRWSFDEDPDMTAGIYYSFGAWNFYIWGDDFFKKNPRLVIGVDFCLPVMQK